MKEWNKLKEIMKKADKNPYLCATFYPNDVLKLMKNIEERPFVYKVTDIKGNVYYCKPGLLKGYMIHKCPECGRERHLNIEWCYNRGFEYCSKCQTVIWESKIISEVYEEDIDDIEHFLSKERFAEVIE